MQLIHRSRINEAKTLRQGVDRGRRTREVLRKLLNLPESPLVKKLTGATRGSYCRRGVTFTSSEAASSSTHPTCRVLQPHPRLIVPSPVLYDIGSRIHPSSTRVSAHGDGPARQDHSLALHAPPSTLCNRAAPRNSSSSRVTTSARRRPNPRPAPPVPLAQNNTV